MKCDFSFIKTKLSQNILFAFLCLFVCLFCVNNLKRAKTISNGRKGLVILQGGKYSCDFVEKNWFVVLQDNVFLAVLTHRV